MRQIYIDLTSENARPLDGKYLGHIGEHNAAELVLTVPQSLVDESDYLVAVFQSGALTFRSRRIYPDSANESAYRVGNSVHCLLGRHLTNEPFLGVQVEGYKLDTDESPVFIGKTRFVPRLILRPSPQGHPGFSFDGSYEDVQNAIDLAHNHTNLASLTKVGETPSGRFTFDGREISGGGIASYHDFDSLPDNAESGTLAYAENDTMTQLEETIAPLTLYHSIGVKDVPDSTALDNMALVTTANGDEVQSYMCEMFIERPGEEERSCYLQTIFAPGVASLFMVGGLEQDRIARAYVPGGRNEYSDNPFYMYNFHDNFDASVMADVAQPSVYSAGWYRVDEQRVNYRAENNHLEYEYQTIIEPVRFEDTPLTGIFSNCHIEIHEEEDEGQSVNVAELSIMLSKLLNVSSSPIHKKGLYFYDGGEWRRFKSGDVTVAENRLTLPENADEGDLAVVQSSSYIYSRESGRLVNQGDSTNAIHINPCLNSLARLYDVEIAAVYGYYGNDPNTGIYGIVTNSGAGFEFITNIEENYALLSISPNNLTSDREHYIYSWTEQTLSFSSGSDLGNTAMIELPLSIGWNKVETDAFTGEYNGVSPIVNPNDLPTLTADNYVGGTTYAYYFSTCYSSWLGNSFNQNYFNDTQYFSTDNAAGLWGYFGGSWQKLENNLIYTIEYGDDY